jgi:cytochrome c
MKRISIVVAVLTCAILVACESHRNNSAWSTAPAGGSLVGTTTGGASPSTAVTGSGKGVGPVTDTVDLASLDESKKDAGAKLFQEKCSACHKLDERYIGPALVGVTQRRQPEWILNMILNPDVMIVQDPTAKGLLATFLTPMANQHLTRGEAECVLVYFREHDKEAGEAKHGDDASNPQAASTATPPTGTSH